MAMNMAMSEAVLKRENTEFLGTGGRSQENRGLGFVPAFMDSETSAVYRSCFANGNPAPIHVLDGLPAELVLTRSATGRVATVKSSVISGFLLGDEFFSREAAAQKINELH
jgi:hypothetical protein